MGARASVKVDVVFSGTYVDDRYTNMLIYLCTVLMITNKFIMNNFIFQFFNSNFIQLKIWIHDKWWYIQKYLGGTIDELIHNANISAKTNNEISHSNYKYPKQQQQQSSSSNDAPVYQEEEEEENSNLLLLTSNSPVLNSRESIKESQNMKLLSMISMV
jgi:hypothetical protein